MNQQETAAPGAFDKKQVRKQIGDKLIGALEEYKQELGEKKLAIRVKSISKLLSRDLLKSKKHKKQVKKSTAKKARKKAVKQ